MVAAQKESPAMKAFSFPAIALAGAMLLAGCSGETGGKGEGKASEDAAKAIGNMPRPQPGLYKTTVTMTGLEIPGLPPEMEGHGAGMTTTVEDCLTQADVDKGFGELVKKGQNGECSYERFTVADGKIDAVMACNSQGRSTRMEMTGTTSKTGADLNATMAIDFEGAGKGTMTFTTKHERIGECPAK
jgi:hypothetical protein